MREFKSLGLREFRVQLETTVHKVGRRSAPLLSLGFQGV